MKMGQFDKTNEVIKVLVQINEDLSVPKNVRERISNSIVALNDKACVKEIKIDKSLQELDEIAEDPNLPMYARTQIWYVVSLLESM